MWAYQDRYHLYHMYHLDNLDHLNGSMTVNTALLPCRAARSSEYAF